MPNHSIVVYQTDLPKMVRFWGAGSPPFLRVTKPEISRGLVGITQWGERRPKTGVALLPDLHLQPG